MRRKRFFFSSLKLEKAKIVEGVNLTARLGGDTADKRMELPNSLGIILLGEFVLDFLKLWKF